MMSSVVLHTIQSNLYSFINEQFILIIYQKKKKSPLVLHTDCAIQYIAYKILNFFLKCLINNQNIRIVSYKNL